jgi:hypothetical protein
LPSGLENCEPSVEPEDFGKRGEEVEPEDPGKGGSGSRAGGFWKGGEVEVEREDFGEGGMEVQFKYNRFWV